MDIPPQPLITKDNVTVIIDAYMMFKVEVPELAIYKVADYVQTMNLLT